METKPNSPDILCTEILADAQRQGDEILRRATTEADSILATTNAEAEKIRRDRQTQAHAEAARRTEMILATVTVEANRQRAARIESLLESIREAIRTRLRTGEFDAHASVLTLAAEAIRQLPGTDFILKISPANHASFGDKLAEEISQRTGRSALNLAICAEPTVADGVLIQSADGIQIWDNRLSARLERLWPELRRQIATRTALVDTNQSPGGAA